MSTNLDRAEFRAARRNPTYIYPPKREVPAWAQPREDTGLWRFVVVALAIVLGVILCLAFFARVADDVKHEQWAKQAADECVANGQTPHVYRDNKDNVLGVRCE